MDEIVKQRNIETHLKVLTVFMRLKQSYKTGEPVEIGQFNYKVLKDVKNSKVYLLQDFNNTGNYEVIREWGDVEEWYDRYIDEVIEVFAGEIIKDQSNELFDWSNELERGDDELNEWVEQYPYKDYRNENLSDSINDFDQPQLDLLLESMKNSFDKGESFKFYSHNVEVKFVPGSIKVGVYIDGRLVEETENYMPGNMSYLRSGLLDYMGVKVKSEGDDIGDEADELWNEYIDFRDYSKESLSDSIDDFDEYKYDDLKECLKYSLKNRDSFEFYGHDVKLYYTSPHVGNIGLFVDGKLVSSMPYQFDGGHYSFFRGRLMDYLGISISWDNSAYDLDDYEGKDEDFNTFISDTFTDIDGPVLYFNRDFVSDFDGLHIDYEDFRSKFSTGEDDIKFKIGSVRVEFKVKPLLSNSPKDLYSYNLYLNGRKVIVLSSAYFTRGQAIDGIIKLAIKPYAYLDEGDDYMGKEDVEDLGYLTDSKLIDSKFSDIDYGGITVDYNDLVDMLHESCEYYQPFYLGDVKVLMTYDREDNQYNLFLNDEEVSYRGGGYYSPEEAIEHFIGAFFTGFEGINIIREDDNIDEEFYNDLDSYNDL